MSRSWRRGEAAEVPRQETTTPARVQATGASRRSIALFALVFMACGPQSAVPVQVVPPLPTHGGPRWTELTSPHFTLWTDCTEDRAHELIYELERYRQLVVATVFPKAAASARVTVVAVRDASELPLTAKARPSAGTFRARGNATLQTFMMLAAHVQYGYEESVEAGETARAVLFGVFRELPSWLEGALSFYFASLNINERDSMASIGELPVILSHRVSVEGAHLAKLFACVSEACVNKDTTTTGWAVVAYLFSERAGELAAYLELLAAGRPADLAWAQAVPTPLDVLERDVRAWLLSGRHTVLHYKVQFPHWQVTERALADAEILAVRALMSSLVPDTGMARMRADRDAALALAPTNVLANMLALADHRNIDRERASAIVAAHPDDWRAWWIAGRSLDGAPALAARAQACALAAANPAAEPPADWCARATTTQADHPADAAGPGAPPTPPAP